MERQYVAIDLHLNRSVVVTENEAGEKVGVTRIDNDPLALAEALRDAGEAPEVAIEATYGWYWAVDILQELGANVHLVNPSGLAWENRRVKNDYRDCCDLLDRMRLGKLPEAWIAPHAVRELRELVRFRARLVMLRTGLKAQLKAVLAKHGLRSPVKDLWGVAGPVWLDQLDLPRAYTTRIESIRDLVEVYDREIDMLEREIHRELKDDAGYRAIQAIPGVGPTIAAIMVAEIGDVTRFKSPEALCSWAGLTPKHHESDTKVRRGRITKAGSKLVRWAAIEAVSNGRGGPKLKADYHRIAGIDNRCKTQPPVAPGGRYSKDQFYIDLDADTVTCPAGEEVSIRRNDSGDGIAYFEQACDTCPLRSDCTTAAGGRTVQVGRHEALLAEARAQAADPKWLDDYRATRPKAERKLAHLMRRRHGGRRARVRGRKKVGADFNLLAAAHNLARLAILGVRSDPGRTWATT